MSQARPAAPSLSAIADYWRTADERFVVLPNLRARVIGWGEPFCFACGWLAPVPDGPDAWESRALTNWLDRAHLVDHSAGGSSEPSNLVPLCLPCHHAMVDAFDDRMTALAWVTAHTNHGIPYPCYWQMWTFRYLDHGGRIDDDGSPRWARFWRIRGDYLTLLLQPEIGEMLRQLDPGVFSRTWCSPRLDKS